MQFFYIFCNQVGNYFFAGFLPFKLAFSLQLLVCLGGNSHAGLLLIMN